jgi:hypothetical protein
LNPIARAVLPVIVTSGIGSSGSGSGGGSFGNAAPKL